MFSAACAAVIVHRNHFFYLYQQNKSSKSKVKFRCKKVFEAAKIAYAVETRVHHYPKIWRIANNVLDKGKSAIPALLNDLIDLIKQNCLLKTFVRTQILMTQISLYPVSLLELITSKVVKKVLTNVDSSKVSGPNCILVLVLKKCEPELSYILAELFIMCLKESCFLDC